MSKEKWSGINPLSQHDIKVLDSLGLDDTRRKINELAEEVTKIKEQCFFGKEMTVNICNGKELSEDAIDDYDYFENKARKEERKRIGEELKKWFNGEGNEDVEDTIERLTGVKV